ncbi:hypothetical protein DXG03_002469 [Asterophora parasitica]|uniref:Uncharacterized protein n=1 Tax=Asterophora parasitica TaxID=117018 RepID=A0A9P7KC89_9AGAR|nr:hypothetical protein DXG03_002469 [Asterophora parasitica]
MSAPGPPNVAEIPLPPGFTLEQFFAFQSSLVSISITAAIAFGVIGWDYFYLLPDEYKFYIGAKKAAWKTLAPYSFLRCAGVVSILAAMCISSIQSDYCQIGFTVSRTAAVIVVATSGIAFGYRLMSVWGPQRCRIITSLIAGTYLLMVGTWIASASQYRATNGAPTPFGSNCRLTPFDFWAPLSQGASALFNVTVLVLLFLGLLEQRSSGKPNISHPVYQESLTNVAIATAADIAVLIVLALGPEYQLAKQIVLPFSTLITATMGARVFLAHLSAVSSGGVRQPAFQDAAKVAHPPPKAPGKTADKDVYGIGTAAPFASPRSLSDEKGTPSISESYTSFPSPTPTFATVPSATSAASSPQLSYKAPPPRGQSPGSPQTLPPGITIAPAPAPAARKFPHNAYTTFPSPPPSPAPPPQVVLPRESTSIDSVTPLLKTRFGRLGRKQSTEDELPKSGWV